MQLWIWEPNHTAKGNPKIWNLSIDMMNDGIILESDAESYIQGWIERGSSKIRTSNTFAVDKSKGADLESSLTESFKAGN